MSAAPLVSIVTATWNRSDLLPATIESVLRQTYAPLEYVVVDDGSTDATPEILKIYGERIRAVRIEHGADYGASALRRGMAEAHGELIGFLDHDDLFLPHKIARQVAELQRDSAAVGVHCGYHYADDAGTLIEHTIGLPEGSYSEILRANMVWSGAPLLRRAALEKAGGYDAAWCGDWRTWLNVTRAGGRMLCVQEPLGVYRIAGGGMMSNLAALRSASLAALDDEFADGASLPPELRCEAYGNMHMFLAGRCYAAGDSGAGADHLQQALGFLPSLQRDPPRLIARLAADAAGPRTPDAERYVQALLNRLPQRAERMRNDEAQLRTAVAFGMACRCAAHGEVHGARTALSQAAAIDPAWPRDGEAFVSALVDRALRVSSCDMHEFVDRMIDAMPPASLLDRTNRVRRRAHADLAVLAALLMPWQRISVQRCMAAFAARPHWVRNRGAVSAAFRVLKASLTKRGADDVVTRGLRPDPIWQRPVKKMLNARRRYDSGFHRNSHL